MKRLRRTHLVPPALFRIASQRRALVLASAYRRWLPPRRLL